MKLYNASMIPPQDCRWHLSLDDFKKKHEKDSGTEFKSEKIGDRGKSGLKLHLKILKSMELRPETDVAKPR